MIMNKSVKFALLAVSALGAGGVVFAGGLPQGGVVQQGAAGIQYTGDTLNINQQSDKAIIRWKDFSVGKGNTVNFNQPSSDSATLNRVTGDFTSEIAGRINANGSVFLVNPNGILITADGVIDTGGFVASTLDIDNNDFLNGDYTFTKSGNNGVVANHGNISVDDGGFVALLGGAVKNDGTVRALVGKVGFAGGEKIVMSFGNNDFLRVEVPTDKWDTLTDSQGNKVAATVDLGGKVDSRGGFVDITIADASDILRQTISIDGIVSANTVSSTDGFISISGGTVGVTGNGRITADADYGNAGTIAIEADSIDSSGTVSAVAQNGSGGTVKVSLQHGANLNASTRFDVSGKTKGGSLSFIGGLDKIGTKVLGSADFKADSTDGTGGYIDISNKGGLVGLFSGTVSASGKTQGGRIRLGGAFQGGGYNPKTSSLDKRTQDLFVTRWSDNSPLVRAGKTSLGTGVNVVVSSQSGTGGTAILWADHTTNNYAAIDASGATGGGAVEISGKKQVDSFGLKRIKAGDGIILLDPQDVVIGNWGSAVAQAKKIAHGASVSLSDNDWFGSSVSLSGDGKKLAVGAMYDDGGSNQSANRGAVYLFTVGGSDSTWGSTVKQAVKLSHGAALSSGTVALDNDDQFGSSVSLSGDGTKLAVGAVGDDDGGSNQNANRGAVYLYTVGGSGATWGSTVTQAVKLSDSHASVSLDDSDGFGSSVSLSGDRKKLAVGAYRDDDGGSNQSANRGAVYLYTVTGSTVTQAVKLSNSHASVSLDDHDGFGRSVSLSGNGAELAVGAYRDDDGGSSQSANRGAVYLYTVTGSTVTQAVKLSNSHASVSLDDGDWFGSSVSLSGDGTKLAVGAIDDDDGGKTDSGAVYLYTVGGSSATWGKTVTQAVKLSHGASGVGLLNNDDNFGWSVSLSGDGTKLAVGATGDDDGGGINKGAVYLLNVPVGNLAGIKQKLQGTDVTIVADQDIAINSDFVTTTGGKKLTLIAGRSVILKNDVKIHGGLEIIANANKTTVGKETDYNNDRMDNDNRTAGIAKITAAKGTTLSATTGNVVIKMQQGNTDNSSDDKRYAGTITIHKVEGQKVSIIHNGTTFDTSKPYESRSEIIILNGGKITSKGTISKGAVAIELKANIFTNKSDKDALAIVESDSGKNDNEGRYLVWTKSPANNQMGTLGSFISSYSFAQFNKSYAPDAVGSGDFKANPAVAGDANTTTKSGFIYSANPTLRLTASKAAKTKVYDGNEHASTTSLALALKNEDSNNVATIGGLKFKIGDVSGNANKALDFKITLNVNAVKGEYRKTDGLATQTDVGNNLRIRYSGHSATYTDGNSVPVYGLASSPTIDDITGASITQKLLQLEIYDLAVRNREYEKDYFIAPVYVRNNASGYSGAVVSGETVILTINDGAFMYNDDSVGKNKRISTGDISKFILNSQNYKLQYKGANLVPGIFTTELKGTISPKTVTLDMSELEVKDREYDGTKNAPVSVINGKSGVNGVLPSETVQLTIKTGAFVYANANVGQNKAVYIGDKDKLELSSKNYKLQLSNALLTGAVPIYGLKGTISPKLLQLEIYDLAVRDRQYESGNIIAPVYIERKPGYSGAVVSGETVILTINDGAFMYNDDSVGKNKRISTGDISKFILNSQNYKLQYKGANLVPGIFTTELKGTISPKTVTLDMSELEVKDREYDGTKNAPVSVINGKSGVNGVLPSETVQLTIKTGAFVYANANVGQNKAVYIGDKDKLELSSKNYKLQLSNALLTGAVPIYGLKGTISPKLLQLEIYDLAVRDRQYESGNIIAPVYIERKPGYSGAVVSGETVTLTIKDGAFVYYNDKVGSDKPVTLNNPNLLILDSKNYRLQYDNIDLGMLTGNISQTTSGDSGDLNLDNSGGGSGGGGGGGADGAAAGILLGAGAAVLLSGGSGDTCGDWHGRCNDVSFVGNIDTIFNTNIYAHLNGIEMQALYQPPTQPSVFNTPHKVTYKAKYKSQIHRTYDMTILANNIKAQQAVPLYELDEQLYETLKRIFVQQSTPTHKTVRTDTKKV